MVMTSVFLVMVVSIDIGMQMSSEISVGTDSRINSVGGRNGSSTYKKNSYAGKAVYSGPHYLTWASKCLANWLSLKMIIYIKEGGLRV